MMRRGARLPIEALSPYLVEVPQPRFSPAAAADPATPVLPLDWPTIFGNYHPVEIEVGFGKGLFLLNAGAARPQSNFFGIEIERKYVLLAATRLARKGLTNVKVACGDARYVLANVIPAETVAALHVYFPDPWWKQRHRKRRLFTADFAQASARVLTSGGRLHFVSDVQAYFDETIDMLKSFPQLAAIAPPDVKAPEHDMDYLTNFERKYRREGRPIYRAAWQKA
jgi:tRNA (guanine-N7-)-methyltransferase